MLSFWVNVLYEKIMSVLKGINIFVVSATVKPKKAAMCTLVYNLQYACDNECFYILDQLFQVKVLADPKTGNFLFFFELSSAFACLLALECLLI